MVRFSMMNDNESGTDQDDADLSPQMIKTTTDLSTNKNNDIPSDLQEEIELFPKPDNTSSMIEKRDEKDEKTHFVFEDLNLFLEQVNEVHRSRENEAEGFIFGIDVKDCTEDHDVASECPSDEDDNSSISSSSSSAVFEFFDDVSILTDEDSIDASDDEDSDELSDILMSLSTGGIRTQVGKDVHAMVFSLTQGGLFENHHVKEKQYSLEDLAISEEMNVCKALKDHISHDSLVGFYEDGFSPMDELRLA